MLHPFECKEREAMNSNDSGGDRNLIDAVAEETLQDFLDPRRNLNGRIGPFKINFNKNLKRF